MTEKNQNLSIGVKMGVKSFALSVALVALVAGSLLVAQPAMADQTERAQVKLPILIGHRGSSGYLPEHTLPGYALAIELGADYVEPDLVATKDGVLIARHEPNMINTTDVSKRPEFAGRKRFATVDGVREEGFFASDFTLAEIKQLRAVQAFGERDQSFNGLYEIPTLDEIITLVKRKSKEVGRQVGIYPETKHPTYHQKLGLPLEDRLLEVLTRHGWNKKGSPVFIQSFEVSNLKYLRKLTPLPLIQLIDGDDVAADGAVTLAPPYDKPYDFAVVGDPRTFKDMLSPAGLKEIATYANGIGPWKPYLISSKCITLNGAACADATGDGKVDERDRVLIEPTSVVKDAHDAGLLVHAFTQRNEPRRLISNYNGNPVNEFETLYAVGIDGFFSDFTDTARTSRYLFALKTMPQALKCLTGNRDDAESKLCRTLRGFDE
jgi:glycerophosphoryl diester phosphodiesterase